ncbi:MAG: hypothetical protein EOR78_28000 [Mesorhizobium sp.]|uniref:hypothetical protein n=1 Tax=Mesorhizobium sp. TaxID=1871066 RepID=UPI000FE4D64A|nr:hypothetical protein [Mesorhizobium sp.]RWA97929.1 MAG: hypothetical protein EOQ33_29495 [Mesorhizobium sp.]RWK59791.1 MAG: hypothetical protein EOR49_24690 [Mesorhizobium sp.]RWM44451.1 MAG: hypothetical protein EOR76_25085 [Mesorhizobium sp.]RWM49125.1 MAG: hypothetical protein EOR78_28000 [Mesorhizobium sp.]TIM88594.1 MAG: hypothetical protein E5Y50_08280 [Mesorhizobium sp.]
MSKKFGQNRFIEPHRMKDEGISFDIDESDDVRLPPEPRVEAAHAILEPCVNARGQIILAASSVENICAGSAELVIVPPKNARFVAAIVTGEFVPCLLAAGSVIALPGPRLVVASAIGDPVDPLEPKLTS